MPLVMAEAQKPEHGATNTKVMVLIQGMHELFKYLNTMQVTLDTRVCQMHVKM